MIYDVLERPWLPLVTKAGQTVSVGVREALAQAHNYASLRGQNPMETFGMYRLLLAFLQDALRPEDSYELEDIVEKGCFDADKLEAYYQACREPGECFDLFDALRPFMQTVFPSGEEVKELPISTLFLQWPTGNNHIHFNHQLEHKLRVTPAECLRVLCTIPSFQLSFGRSKHCSVNGNPPNYFLYAGDNLFEILSLSMVSRAQLDNLSYDDPPVAWRDVVPVPNRLPPAKVSLLHGFTARPLRIQLAKPENEQIASVKASHGYEYKQLQNWRDPHVAYVLNKKGEEYPLPIREGREAWRDMGTILCRESKPVFMKQLPELMSLVPGERRTAYFQVFGLVSEQKTAMLLPAGWVEETLPLYASMLKSPDMAAFLQLCLELMEDINRFLAYIMCRTLTQLQGKTGGKSKATGSYQFLTEQVQNLFLSNVRHYLLSTFLSEMEALQRSKPDWDFYCRMEWGVKLRTFALEAFQETLSSLAQSATLLRWRSLAENYLTSELHKKLKKGGFLKHDGTSK